MLSTAAITCALENAASALLGVGTTTNVTSLPATACWMSPVAWIRAPGDVEELLQPGLGDRRAASLDRGHAGGVLVDANGLEPPGREDREQRAAQLAQPDHRHSHARAPRPSKRTYNNATSDMQRDLHIRLLSQPEIVRTPEFQDFGRTQGCFSVLPLGSSCGKL